MSQERIHGLVYEVIFENENGFKICNLDVKGDLVTIKGNLAFIEVGETITAEGSFEMHPVYGEQFAVKSYLKELPQGKDNIEIFLASGLIRGVGEKLAQRIVESFGIDSLDIIIERPEELAGIKGISMKKAHEISQACKIHREMADLAAFMSYYGLLSRHTMEIFKKYGSLALEMIKENPYRLLEDIGRISFEKVDSIALDLGYPEDSYARVCAYIIYILKSSLFKGHVYLPYDDIYYNLRILKASYEDGLHCVNLLKEEKSVVVIEDERTLVYLSYIYECQTYVEDKLKILAKGQYKLDAKEIDKKIGLFEENSSIKLAKKQKLAIETAATKGVSIITGGPGTGKTTIIKGILYLIDSLNLKTLLCAPTGRAAKRMSELCNCQAKTIHRLLEVNSNLETEEDHTVQFNKNDDSPLDCDVLIIDEVSMIDTILFYHLLRAVRTNTRLVFVGDKDQLPSVGPGNVLKDMLNSKLFDTVTLSEIYRQEEESLITINAHSINKGEMPKVNEKNKDFFFIREKNQEDCLETLVGLATKRLVTTYKLDPKKDIQILIPTKKGTCGVINVNKVLQKHINPEEKDKREYSLGETIFREGDRVMQIKNNYNIEWKKVDTLERGNGVFNGEMGTLLEIDKSQGLIYVEYDDSRQVAYEYNQLNELEHSFAITVHKSQGSEFDYVIIPILPIAPMLMTRNLLYTAITRAKKLVVLVGREDAMKNMIDNNTEELRYTGLFKE